MEFTAMQDGLRVDVFLAGCLPELTRSAVQRLLAEGGVTCGGARGDRCTGYPARYRL